ncbi:hypothetical protein ILYODFUR_030553 [Ilyodon furcidens]|uniref:Uncharacterized protein n=1 Tax=Ilyodon furcidens TaxID=33524 RepID=A0ABV0TN24_9TELE
MPAVELTGTNWVFLFKSEQQGQSVQKLPSSNRMRLGPCLLVLLGRDCLSTEASDPVHSHNGSAESWEPVLSHNESAESWEPVPSHNGSAESWEPVPSHNGSAESWEPVPSHNGSAESSEDLEENLVEEGDMIVMEDRNAIKRVWPNAIVPYEIRLNLGRVAEIRKAFRMI